MPFFPSHIFSPNVEKGQKDDLVDRLGHDYLANGFMTLDLALHLHIYSKPCAFFASFFFLQSIIAAGFCLLSNLNPYFLE